MVEVRDEKVKVCTGCGRAVGGLQIEFVELFKRNRFEKFCVTWVSLS